MLKNSNILIGGAVAVSQYEGSFGKTGRGYNTQDVRAYIPRTADATTATRLLDRKMLAQAILNLEVISDSSSAVEVLEKKANYYPFRVGSRGIDHLDEDIELLKGMHLDVFRTSITWSYLFPTGEEEKANPEAIAYYTNFFKKIKNAGMKLFLSMNHYDVPLALVLNAGGWKNRHIIDCYLRLARTIFAEWGDLVDYYLPINEINAGYFSPFNGVGLLLEDKGRSDNQEKISREYSEQDIYQSLHHQFIASAKSIALGRKMGVKGKFGCMFSYFGYYPMTPSPIDNLQVMQAENWYQWFYGDVLSRGEYPAYMKTYFHEHGIQLEFAPDDVEILATNTCDFVSFSYYQSSVLGAEGGEMTAGNLVSSLKNPYLKASEWGWQIDPIGLQIACQRVYDRYQKPIIIAENGFGAHDKLEADDNGEMRVHDSYRIDYIREHIEALLQAEKENVPIEAYFIWGVLDIVSAGSCEMEKRYGMVYVDADNRGNGTYHRFKKDSYDWIQKLMIERDNPETGKEASNG